MNPKNRFDRSNELNCKETLLLKSLIVFYRDKKNMDILLCFLKGKQRRLSLRLLDWLVTNYSKNHAVIINDTTTNVSNVEFMYLAYKNHLKSYSKKFFDAFARRQRIFYTFDHHVYKIRTAEMNSYYNRTDGFVTTIAQLNAFRFFISSGVVDYAIKHLEEVEKDMVSYHSKKCNNEPKLTGTNFQTCVTYHVKMTVQLK